MRLSSAEVGFAGFVECMYCWIGIGWFRSSGWMFVYLGWVKIGMSLSPTGGSYGW